MDKIPAFAWDRISDGAVPLQLGDPCGNRRRRQKSGLTDFLQRSPRIRLQNVQNLFIDFIHWRFLPFSCLLCILKILYHTYHGKQTNTDMS
jgi:hypothetical protein